MIKKIFFIVMIFYINLIDNFIKLFLYANNKIFFKIKIFFKKTIFTVLNYYIDLINNFIIFFNFFYSCFIFFFAKTIEFIPYNISYVFEEFIFIVKNENFFFTMLWFIFLPIVSFLITILFIIGFFFY